MIAPQRLRQCLTYEPTTGKLFWKKRDDVRACWNGKHAGKEAFTYTHKEGYRVGTFEKRQLKAHRVAWAIHFGKWPTQIDHINGNREDNRLANLREVTARENSKNRGIRADNTSGHVGVCWDAKEGRWVVQIAINGKNKRVGSYDDLAKAIGVRKDAEREHGYHENHGLPRSKASRRRLSKAAQERRT